MKHWADYVIFSGFILISLSIGLYHALTGGRQRTTEEFIMADRKLKAENAVQMLWVIRANTGGEPCGDTARCAVCLGCFKRADLLPVALSLLMSYQSAITIIGVPAEIYSYGIQAWPMWNLGFWLALILSERLFVPWLYPLKLTSVNKYFELRFGDREIRAFACLVGVLSAIMYMGVCMFAPAVALETATGFPTMASIPAMSIVCIIYTAMGGMRAVIWTDVFQFGVMLAGMLAVLIRGMILVGGAPNAFNTLVQEGRDELINISPSLLERQTLWGYIFGWSLQWGCVFGLQQAAVQRFSAMPSLRGARLSLLLNMPGLLLVNSLANLIGITVFAYYTMEKCDPILSGTISDPNQLLPQFVNEIFANAKGFSGLFLATLFSGALSSVSSSLSGAAANVWEDILKYRLPGIQEHKAAIINKCLVVVLGLLAAGFAFLSAVMTGPIAQLAIAFFGACGGPLLGLFILSGIRQFRWIRSRAVLAGAMLGLTVNMWLSIAAAFVKGKYEVLPPLSVEHCDPPINTTLPAAPVITGIDKFYSLSFLWYTPLGCVITIVIGLSVSAIINACNKPKYSRDVPENLFIPFSQVFSFCDKEYSPVSQGDKDTTNKECQMIDLLEEKIQTLTD